MLPLETLGKNMKLRLECGLKRVWNFLSDSALYNRSAQWYTAVILNQVLMKALPTVDDLRGVMAKTIPFLEASTKSNRLVSE